MNAQKPKTTAIDDAELKAWIKKKIGPIQPGEKIKFGIAASYPNEKSK